MFTHSEYIQFPVPWKSYSQQFNLKHFMNQINPFFLVRVMCLMWFFNQTSTVIA